MNWTALPRPGGEADKLGNKYELAWIVRHALYCFLDERRSLTIEDVDPEIGKGSEFTYDTGVFAEVHQLKRQNRNSNSWTVKALADLMVFDAAAAHVTAGRRYHFVSLVPCRPLQELSERARKSADVASFTRLWLTEDLRPVFDQLSASEVLGSPQTAWATLRGMWFSVHDESDIVRMNSMLAECHLSGSTGHLVSLAIGDILLDNLGKRLTRAELLELLAVQEIRPLVWDSRRTAREQILALTNSWRESIQRESLQPAIERLEVAQLVEALGLNRVGLVVGAAGGGKSSVLEQAVASLEANGANVLALRLDRLDALASSADLGRRLGLDTSPAVALALAADDRDAYLVVDQLDAVSLASGRMPESFDVVMDLIREALSVACVRVILACRSFDIENDHRIRSLAAASDVVTVQVGLLPADAVDGAVANMGLGPMRLTTLQRELLQTPLHLVLLQTIAHQDDALAFQSKGSLFEAFWERKRQTARMRRRDVRFNDVLRRVADVASGRQTLSVPVEILDDGDLIEDANVLVSEHVLARDGDRIAFFHEAFFDYVFARQWVSSSESLIEFLLRDEQELFRRAQVRQILQHLYEREPERFRDEVKSVLTADEIRFHIKETVLAVVGGLHTPTSEDADLVLSVAATVPRFGGRIWQQVQRAQWFSRFQVEGLITAWLDDPDSVMRDRAVNMMAGAVREHPGAIAELLGDRKTVPEYMVWMRRVTRFAELHNERRLFELVLDGVRQGAYDPAEPEFWQTAHNLAENQPLWAIELLQAWLVERADALALNDDGKVAVLGTREYGASDMVRDAAASEPLAFVLTIVPYLCKVMAVTATEPQDNYPISDQHFSFRFDVDDLDNRDLDEALLAASVRSLEMLAQSDPEAVRSLLEGLSHDPHDGSQFLLYRALTAGATNFASWASSLLLEGGQRLDWGYMSDADWIVRELVRAIAPIISDEAHENLEELFRDLRNAHESRDAAGRLAFTFLSALEESRLAAAGRRRLAEYRRKFKEDAPSKPCRLMGGIIGSPIGSDAASKMTDAQWLKAIAKHDSDRTDWDSFTGGARELSHVLRQQTAADPERFARFALQLKAKYNAAYGDAVLIGLGDAESSPEIDPLVFDAVRHIVSLRQPANDRWLGMALRKRYRDVPLDLIKIILDRTLHAPDPADSSEVSAADMRFSGMNSARGSLAETLGDLLVFDVDGKRTELVVPHLEALASDPVLSVRSCVAHTIAASLRHARPEALLAFDRLINADDKLLAAGFVQRLMLYIGNVDPEVIDPIIQRMLASDSREAREAGGRIASFSALEWTRSELMDQALSGDAYVRKGVAEVCAARADGTSNVALATASLMCLMYDDDDEVRKAAAAIAPNLRERPLRPFSELLTTLIGSPSYVHATPQLLLTLQYAPDKVDDLVLRTAQRFMGDASRDAGEIRAGAAGAARYIGKLVVRGLAQSRDRTHRAALLGVLDRLLEMDVYGISEAIADSERI